MPTTMSFVCDDIDHAADGIGAEAHRYYALVNLDTLGKTRWDVVQVESLPDSFLRHTVNKNFDVFTTETVKHQPHVGTHATRFSELHAGQ